VIGPHFTEAWPQRHWRTMKARKTEITTQNEKRLACYGLKDIILN